MSGLPVEYEFSNNPSGEVTANDRDTMSARLNDAFAAGDLSMDEYQARLQDLFGATKKADLVPILAGLPGRYRSVQPVLGGDQPGGKPGELQPLRPAPKGLMRVGAATAGVLVILIVLLVILL